MLNTNYGSNLQNYVHSNQIKSSAEGTANYNSGNSHQECPLIKKSTGLAFKAYNLAFRSLNPTISISRPGRQEPVSLEIKPDQLRTILETATGKELSAKIQESIINKELAAFASVLNGDKALAHCSIKDIDGGKVYTANRLGVTYEYNEGTKKLTVKTPGENDVVIQNPTAIGIGNDLKQKLPQYISVANNLERILNAGLNELSDVSYIKLDDRRFEIKATFEGKTYTFNNEFSKQDPKERFFFKENGLPIEFFKEEDAAKISTILQKFDILYKNEIINYVIDSFRKNESFIGVPTDASIPRSHQSYELRSTINGYPCQLTKEVDGNNEKYTLMANISGKINTIEINPGEQLDALKSLFEQNRPHLRALVESAVEDLNKKDQYQNASAVVDPNDGSFTQSVSIGDKTYTLKEFRDKTLDKVLNFLTITENNKDLGKFDITNCDIEENIKTIFNSQVSSHIEKEFGLGEGYDVTSTLNRMILASQKNEITWTDPVGNILNQGVTAHLRDDSKISFMEKVELFGGNRKYMMFDMPNKPTLVLSISGDSEKEAFEVLMKAFVLTRLAKGEISDSAIDSQAYKKDIAAYLGNLDRQSLPKE